jgi:hypothetical protein
MRWDIENRLTAVRILQDVRANSRSLYERLQTFTKFYKIYLVSYWLIHPGKARARSLLSPWLQSELKNFEKRQLKQIVKV